jgi:hypothetical protein
VPPFLLAYGLPGPMPRSDSQGRCVSAFPTADAAWIARHREPTRDDGRRFPANRRL